MMSSMSKVDKVYNYCFYKIHAGEWKPGEKIPSENELYYALNISKISIRSALQQLRAKGIITTHHGKGSFVSEHVDIADLNSKEVIVNITPKELIDITEFREAIEVKAVELCIQNATERDLADIKAALDKMEGSTDNYQAYSSADAEFHMAILVGTHNKIMYHSVMSIQNEFKKYLDELNRVFVKHNLEDSFKLHKQLYHSILMKDEKLAASLVMLNLRRNILRIKRKMDGGDVDDYLHL